MLFKSSMEIRDDWSQENTTKSLRPNEHKNDRKITKVSS